jgi:hypothetical protein
MITAPPKRRRRLPAVLVVLAAFVAVMATVMAVRYLVEKEVHSMPDSKETFEKLVADFEQAQEEASAQASAQYLCPHDVPAYLDSAFDFPDEEVENTSRYVVSVTNLRVQGDLAAADVYIAAEGGSSDIPVPMGFERVSGQWKICSTARSRIGADTEP